MKRIVVLLLTLLPICMMAQSVQTTDLNEMTEKERNEYLVNLAREVSENIAPEWLQGDVVPKVSSKQKYFSTNKRPDIQRNVGREFYSVTFYYDEATKAKLKYDYATRVRIWADNGEVEGIMTGEDWGRVFHETSYEQMKQRGIKREEQMSFVPLQPSVILVQDTECSLGTELKLCLTLEKVDTIVNHNEFERS